MTSPVISEGPPPLTEEAADCAIDVIDVMAAVVRGVDTIDVTPAVRQVWRRHLVTYYPMLNPSDRYFFATAHYALANIQQAWSGLSEAQRDTYRVVWASSLPALLQFAAPAIGVDPSFGHAGYASQPTASGAYSPAQGPAYEMTGQASAGDYVNQILSYQRAEMREAEARGPEEAARLQRQQDSDNAAQLSRMASARYGDLMNVAINLRS